MFELLVKTRNNTNNEKIVVIYSENRLEYGEPIIRNGIFIGEVVCCNKIKKSFWEKLYRKIVRCLGRG